MRHPIFRWIDCTDKRRPHDLRRDDSSKLRLAQITDMHLPGEMPLSRRIREMVRGQRNIHELSHQISALTNEFGHNWRKNRKSYANHLKKALLGLHSLDVDHLLITGDLVHCGLEPEFLDIKAILELTRWNQPEILTVIPGNHDRFNLYESLPSKPMEAFFDVVDSRHPRYKKLPGGIVLLEFDSNRDPIDDRQALEKWLPNTIGRIYPEELEWFESVRQELEGSRLIVLVHHHFTEGWYPPLNPIHNFRGVLDPTESIQELIELTELVDPHSIVLHGHIHAPMPIGYTFGDHLVGNPGGFGNTLRVNLLDVDAHDAIVMTQIELRV